MPKWDNDDAWSTRGDGGGAAVDSSSWDAGIPLPGDWDAGIKASDADTFKADGFTNGNFETNGDHANPMDNAGAGGDDRACRICKQIGHLARECAQKPEGFGQCHNCGEEGHNKADCTNAKVFTGECRICSKQGHAARDCPDKPPAICRNCKQEGHIISECTNKKVFDFLANLPTLSEEDAWNNVIRTAKEAVGTRELDDFRESIQAYQKAVKEVSYEQLERSFRTNGIGIYIIAMEPREGEILDTHTLVDLSGKKDCKYKVGYFFKKTPRTEKLADVWPTSEEENRVRLKDAGAPYERGIPKCLRCKVHPLPEMGHTAKACTQDETEIDKPSVKCVICQEDGHRARDCTQVRVDRFACRNCNEEGHMSKECEKPKNPATAMCRNCDEVGHFSKDCLKPKDWSKVKCNNCQEMGHTSKRCPQAKAEAADEFNDGGVDAAGGEWGPTGGSQAGAAGAAGGSGWDNAGVGADASSSWGNASATPAPIKTGGW
ncbi:MAG: hypothetical protein LQ339_007922 [Xanthoria mediterranea]|nr:MAG: hypothetical protein LQ339_007922 [Xanthoria mediterranea]